MKSELTKALEQSLNEYIAENKKYKDEIEKLLEDKCKISTENYELRKKNRELEATVDDLSERILDLEACK